MHQVKTEDLSLTTAIKQAKRPYVYAVIVENGKNLPPVLQQSPTICTFYGTCFYVNNKKAATALQNDLYRMHPNRIYSIVKIELLSSKGK